MKKEKTQKFVLNKQMLGGEGEEELYVGVTSDKDINFYGWGDSEKSLLFVVCKGYIDDWCVYVEGMDRSMNVEEVKQFGNKISPEKAMLLVECDKLVLERYRL